TSTALSSLPASTEAKTVNGNSNGIVDDEIINNANVTDNGSGDRGNSSDSSGNDSPKVRSELTASEIRSLNRIHTPIDWGALETDGRSFSAAEFCLTRAHQQLWDNSRFRRVLIRSDDRNSLARAEKHPDTRASRVACDTSQPKNSKKYTSNANASMCIIDPRSLSCQFLSNPL
ncbi:unnamed protein product, partial [Rhizoctonia solani]